MKNEIVFSPLDTGLNKFQELLLLENKEYPEYTLINRKQNLISDQKLDLAEILVITSYPPRECGIATYSQDLIKALDNKFSNSLSIKVCALESGDANYQYPDEVKYILKTSRAAEFKKLAFKINKDDCIEIVLIQHEFGFYKEQEQSFLQFLTELSKPVVIVFHTVLPHPDEQLKSKIKIGRASCRERV